MANYRIQYIHRLINLHSWDCLPIQESIIKMGFLKLLTCVSLTPSQSLPVLIHTHLTTLPHNVYPSPTSPAHVYTQPHSHTNAYQLLPTFPLFLPHLIKSYHHSSLQSLTRNHIPTFYIYLFYFIYIDKWLCQALISLFPFITWPYWWWCHIKSTRYPL